MSMNLSGVIFQGFGEYDFQAHSYPSDHFVNSYDLSYSCVPPVLCNYCKSPYHDAYTCHFHSYVDATCASFEKKINDMTDQMIETMKVTIAAYSPYFNQNSETYNESDSMLGFLNLLLVLMMILIPFINLGPT